MCSQGSNQQKASDLVKAIAWHRIHLDIYYNRAQKELIHWGRVMHIHDDVIKWKHFPHYWPFVRGIHRSPVNSPHKGQWHGALMFTLICVRINGWVNNREAGDLRRYRTHYDVIVMICVRKLTIIGSDKGLSPSRRQAIIWTNAGILLIWILGTNFSGTLIEIHIFSFKKIHLQMLSAKCRPFCLSLNVLNFVQCHNYL